MSKLVINVNPIEGYEENYYRAISRTLADVLPWVNTCLNTFNYKPHYIGEDAELETIDFNFEVDDDITENEVYMTIELLNDALNMLADFELEEV